MKAFTTPPPYQVYRRRRLAALLILMLLSSTIVGAGILRPSYTNTAPRGIAQANATVPVSSALDTEQGEDEPSRPFGQRMTPSPDGSPLAATATGMAAADTSAISPDGNQETQEY